jgi:hypothetical protein
LEVFIGEVWVPAEVCFSMTREPFRYPYDSYFSSDASVVRVRLVEHHQELDSQELRFWRARLAKTTEGGDVTEGERSSPRALLGVAVTDASLLGVASEGDSLSSRIPALPPCLIADALVADFGYSRVWRSRSLSGGDTSECEAFVLPSPLRERILQDLEKLRLSPHASLPHIHSLYEHESGVLAVRPFEYGWKALKDELLKGVVSVEQLLDAFFHAACGIDHLAAIGASAHHNILLDNFRWREEEYRVDNACHPATIEIEGPKGAVGNLAPECFAGNAPSHLSDQFALAVAYVEARTQRNPLIPNSLEILSGKTAVPLSGLYPQEATVVRRALSADPGKRWRTAEGFVQALTRAVGVARPWLDPSQRESIALEPVALISGDAEPDSSWCHPLSLADYRRLCLEVPRPTPEQIEAFVIHVASKHSWYKHLPMTPPGVRFIVYMDPGAGLQRFESADGEVAFREIEAGEPLFHYSMKTTADYRRDFGCLAVLDKRAPSFELYSAAGTASMDTGPGVLVDGRILPIPSEIAFVGSVLVTAALHDRSSEPFLWERHFEGRGWASVEEASLSNWPDESGGDAVVDAIRCFHNDPARRLHHYRHVIERLIIPERERQRRLLKTQIERVIALVYDQAE